VGSLTLVPRSNAVVGSGHSYAGGEKNCCIEQGDLEGVKRGNSCGRPATAKFGGGCEAGVVEGSEEAQEKKDF